MDFIKTFEDFDNIINEKKETMSLEDIKKLDGEEVSAKQWEEIRHHKNTKKVSMLGKSNKNKKTEHSVIFDDKSSITVYV
jgi:beta-xylosidase